MGLDFDVNEYIKSLKTKPPYKCPIDKCDKSYKSLAGLQGHLSNYDHENPPFTPTFTPARKKGRARFPSTPASQQLLPSPPKEALTYAEAEKIVQFEVNGKNIRVSISEEIPIVSADVYEKMVDKGNCEIFSVEPPEEPEIKLPQANYKELKNYSICDAPQRPNAYIRFIEKSTEELDGEVEYDVDEEDTTWLSIINDKREKQNLSPVSVDTLELLMDRLEKESYFQAAVNGQGGNVVDVDDDAVCCICMDGECQNSNVILFCDMCNLAVHQDCYGVPYIPEGQWLCRRCLQSPSRPVDCVLCPNTGGAFKQTDRAQWAHVVCALWIPEVRFANTVFLEPIDSIETIPPARWKLCCYICKQKNVGACIQCNKNYCYAAFHVTCAQQAGLCMRMDTVKGTETQPVIVQKSAFCDAHTPSNAIESHNPNETEKAREESRNKMKQARKLLAKKRTSVPVILIPTIPPERVQEIAALVNIQKKAPFIQRLIAYWTLKRQYRNGVPLLRRLQSQGQTQGGYGIRGGFGGGSSGSGLDGSPDARELYQQLKYWQCLRQDLERARLLCELVRKREKLKLALVKTTEQAVMMEINPLDSALGKLLDLIESKDTSEIFLEPVDIEEVADYMDIVTEPMDLGTMRTKLNSGMYSSLNSFESDFQLMIKNCLAYNDKDTVFYRAGIRMKDQCGPLFKSARKELEKRGLVENQKPDEVSQTIGDDLKEILSLINSLPKMEILNKLEVLLNRASNLKHGLSRAKRVKQIKTEINKVKKMTVKENLKMNCITDSSQSDCESKLEIVPEKTPPCSPLKSASNSASPSGVNRRTAVLFTRKAQAAQKKPEPFIKEEDSLLDMETEKPKSPKKAGRTKKNSSKKSNDAGGGASVSGLVTSTSSGPERNKGLSSPKTPNKSFEAIPDSFRVYRGGQQDGELTDSNESNMSSTGSTCSSCSSFSGSCSGSDFGSSFDHSFGSEVVSSDDINDGVKDEDEISTLEPLQMVWAKCRGYPWYPALIIDPEIPNGFVYKGVPLPAPPADVLALKKNYTDHVFLVLFFDAKRTWQWLPSAKLEVLGIDKALDQSKLVESRKPTERKAVKKAYQEALHYQSQVSRAEGPIGKL